MSLIGKTAIVTGGASGIGAATARALVAQGAQVIISDVNDALGRSLADELGAAARFSHHDVSHAEDWQRVVTEAQSAFGAVSILVNNAGVPQLGQTIEQCSEVDYRRIIDINQISVFLGMQAIIPSMRAAGGGSIINVSSAMGLVATVGAIAYVASKFAVTGMSKAAAAELGPAGIRVNSVHPGLIATPMMSEIDPAVIAGIQQFANTLPLGRAGTPAEAAALIAFLASDAASYCTGGAYTVDAGWTAV